jgi:hypothetical protein
MKEYFAGRSVDSCVAIDIYFSIQSDRSAWVEQLFYSPAPPGSIQSPDEVMIWNDSFYGTCALYNNDT